MKKFLESNLFYGVLAVALSIFLMFYVDSAENPIQEKTFYSVGIELVNVPPRYLLESEPGLVEVRVRAYKSALNMVSARDIKALLDLREAQLGESIYPVRVSLPSGLDLVSQRPASVELSIDTVGERELPVTCLTYNTVLEGYEHLEPVVTPGSVTITGPMRVLDKIAEARVSVDLHQRTEDYRNTVPLTLIDDEGMEVLDARLQWSAEAVAVHVVVTENLSSKSVTVRAALTGTISEKYTVNGVEVRPSQVKITGAFSVINQIVHLTTEPINLSDITGTFRENVRLIVPDNVEVLEGNSVELSIEVEENLALREFTGIPVEVRNVPAGSRTYGTIPLTVDITLGAYPWVFANASNDSGGYDIPISAYIDLEEQPAVAREYPIILEFPEEYRIMAKSAEAARPYVN